MKDFLDDTDLFIKENLEILNKIQYMMDLFHLIQINL